MKRKIQIDFEQLIEEVIAGSPVRTALLKATPGAGKSSIPIIAGKLITADIADALAWFVPREKLQHQGECNFQDPFFRDMFQHSLSIRSSTNEQDPCRGLDGFITTYQALGVDSFGTVQQEIKKKRYIVILDEFHHAEYDGIWHKALAPIVKDAEFLILMTGTLERGNGKRIAFAPYRELGNQYEPDLQPGPKTKAIEYTRQDALKDRAIIPLKFRFHDGASTWKDKDSGKEITVKSIARTDEKQSGPAVYTALSTEYAEELLSIGLEHWHEYKRENRRSKFLVVTANISHARKAIKFLNNRNYGAAIATSHESVEAARAIDQFKFGDLDILVTIAMAYEGLDVPPLTHIVCLTHIRSTPWIEQMVARAVRIDHQAGPYESQFGFIFAPDDPRFRKIVEKIRAEQLPIVRKYQQAEQMEIFEQESSGLEEVDQKNIYNIVPLESSLTGKRAITLAHESGDRGFLTPSSTKVQTPKEIESNLRKQIESHIRRYGIRNRIQHGKINRDIMAYFNKSRADMTLSELGSCLSYVQRNYPENKIRGTGRIPVSTKVRPYISQESA